MAITKKQAEIIRCVEQENPKILICTGAKRAGKTWILIYCFLNHVAKYINQKKNFILGGTNQSALRRNVLNEMEEILGRELKLKHDNHFELFGNRIYCFDGANSDSYKKLRGFTSHGAYFNEATTLHDTFIKEGISRCSGDGARIFMDTNPENPTHSVKVDYVDKNGQKLSNGQVNIRSFSFTLFDNTFLSEEYVESIKASTPSGMFHDRDILGKWVSAEGVVFKDFNKEKHYIKELPKNTYITKYYCGVDWGYEHFGSIVLMGDDTEGNTYLLKEYSAQHQEIDYWVNIALEIKRSYGDINFYCDTARPEHIKRFRREGIQAKNADKSVLAGIESISKKLKTDKLFILEDNVKLFKDEIYNYVWNSDKGEPVKKDDDVLDSLRYAIYSEHGKDNMRIDPLRLNI